MKPLSLLLLVLLMGCYACKKTSVQENIKPLPDYKKAAAFLNKRNDSAFYYFNKVIVGSKDSLQIAVSYNQMSVIQSDAGDYFGSQESLSSSLKFLDTAKESHRACLASDYNELGLTSIDLKNYDAAPPFFDQALKCSKSPIFRLSIMNNKALAFQKKADYAQALKIYQTVLVQAIRKQTYSRTLTNIATTRWLFHPSYNAAPELIKALRIRQKEGDSWGENSSYAHLADFYFHSKPDSALFYAQMMLHMAIQLQSPDDQLEALEKLIKLELPTEVKTHFSRYVLLNDSLQTARSKAKNQFALIRYEVEKNKADNLKLQKDNSEKRYEIIQQRVRFYGVLFMFMALAAGTTIWYKKRKRRMEQEAQNKVRESQRKTSKKVHDTLANDIYRIMKKIQHELTLDKDWLIYNINDVYQRARDISYEIITDSDEHFQETIAELLKSFATDTTKIALVGNTEALWQKINTIYKFELRYVLQELMVNMQKHSRANNVVIKFKDQTDHCLISYFDDGIGFPEGTSPKNGLTNVGNRIKAIHGQIIFDSGSKGLQIQITLPIT